MKIRNTIIVGSIIFSAIFGIIYMNQNDVSNAELKATSTIVIPNKGELVTLVSALLPDYSIDDIIRLSEVIVTGTVTDILPAQKGIRSNSGQELIYTDVILKPENCLYGDISSERITIRVWGGRADGDIEIYDDEPVFTLQEKVIVFLCKYSIVSTLSGAQDVPFYYRTTGDLLGKYELKDNVAIQKLTNKQFNIDIIEQKIAAIHLAE